MTLQDSGKREEFSTGAVRDTQENKGRCDLLPLDCLEMGDHFKDAEFISYLKDFKESGDIKNIKAAIRHFIHCHFGSHETAYLELAIHYEEGAKKYGDNNWQKGLPISRYLSSAIRHYLKFRRGDQDEPHDRAVLWNLTAIIWTCKHKPGLNDYIQPYKMVKQSDSEQPQQCEKSIKQIFTDGFVDIFLYNPEPNIRRAIEKDIENALNHPSNIDK